VARRFASEPGKTVSVRFSWGLIFRYFTVLGQALRTFGAFQPLIAADKCRKGALPYWVHVTEEGQFHEWDSEGSIPEIVREWFPDL
ncbi:MAG: hypothetical protein KAY24_10370, partial [Candidatus Eisenbacteria sp.]|nr:hypothetical protein [Candidatus Eisenbacteria bacterium]